MNRKRGKTIKALKTRLKKTLPNSLSKVIDSYEDFLEKEMPEDAKGFSAHHSACKSAVVHAETLLKLAKWTDEEMEKKTDKGDETEIWKIISKAKVENEIDDDED